MEPTSAMPSMFEPQIHMSRAIYESLCELVYHHSRIRLGSGKQALLTGRLSRRLRELGLTSYESYVNRLHGASAAEEIGQLVDLVSTNHTHFFREPQHFDFLRQKVLAEWREGTAQTLQIWSAACSSGEEPYSIALTLNDYYSTRPAALWHVDATDISRRMLHHARAAVYSKDELKTLPPEWLRRHFETGMGSSHGYFRVRRSLSSHVSFHHLNLFQPRYPFTTQFHVIFCRNVMIYFDRESQEQLVQRLTQQLAPGGYLLVGHAESLLGAKHQLRYVQPSIYQKPR